MKSKGFAKSVLAATAITGLSGLVNAGDALAQLNVTVTNTGAFTSTANTNYSAYQPSTIQYNSSQGQNNNFAVGANTSFGVSSSASSTPDYSVTTSSILESAAAGTLLKNQIGSSGASQQTSSWAAAAGSYASSYMSERQSSAEKAAYNSTTGKYEAKFDGASTTTSYDTKAGWENAYKASNEYKTAYTSAFNSAYNSYSGSGSSSANNAVGTISGSFASSTGGATSLSTSGSASLAQSSATKLYVQETVNSNSTYREATADEIKTGKLGGSGAALTFYTGSTTTDASNSKETTTYSVASSEQMRSAAVAAASVNNNTSSSNQVVVTGIGSDSQFASGQNSKFNVGIASNLGKVNQDGTANTATTVMDGITNVVATNNKLILMQGEGAISSSATANGSANGSFGTNSTATSNQATYTSVFYQAF